MTHDRSISPVGWYVGTYQIRFVELARGGTDDPERRFLVWENTVLVRASSLEEAYDKVEAIGMAATEPYQGGPEGVDVQWVYEGVIDLLPVYEELEDGAEILWAERSKKLGNLRARARTREQICQAARQPRQPASAGASRSKRRG